MFMSAVEIEAGPDPKGGQALVLRKPLNTQAIKLSLPLLGERGEQLLKVQAFWLTIVEPCVNQIWRKQSGSQNPAQI